MKLTTVNQHSTSQNAFTLETENPKYLKASTESSEIQTRNLGEKFCLLYCYVTSRFYLLTIHLSPRLVNALLRMLSFNSIYCAPSTINSLMDYLEKIPSTASHSLLLLNCQFCHYYT